MRVPVRKLLGRNPWYIAWSAHRSCSALVLLTVPDGENDQRRDQ
jgi:hypothetical protein